MSRLVPGLRVALTRPATRVDAFSRSDTASVDLGLPIFTTTKSGLGVETLRSFGPTFFKLRVRLFLALEKLDVDDDAFFERAILVGDLKAIVFRFSLKNRCWE
jgi:hypothetical protein